MKTIKNGILILLTAATTLSAQSAQYTSEQTASPVIKDKLIQRVEDFHSAIINNDQQKAADLLTDDARILESEGIETKQEYLSHHFHSDGEFLSAMDREVISQQVKRSGKTRWISTHSKMSGTYNDREITRNSAELIVLVKTGDTWKISAVHWSSRSAK